MQISLEKFYENTKNDNRFYTNVNVDVLDIYLSKFENKKTANMYKNFLVKIIKLTNGYFETNKLNEAIKNLRVNSNTKNLIVTILRTFIKWLNFKFDGNLNPKDLKNYEKELNLRKPLSEKEVNLLKEKLKEFGSTEFELAFKFLLTTGCRIGELTSIDWSTQKNNNILITTLKTKKTRILSISKELFIEIKNNGGLHLTQNSIQEYFRRFRLFLNSLGINLNKPISAHILRHTFATKAYLNGIPLSDIAFLLGHDDIKTTYSIYIKTNEQIQELNFLLANMEMQEALDYESLKSEIKKLKKVIANKEMQIIQLKNQIINAPNNLIISSL